MAQAPPEFPQEFDDILVESDGAGSACRFGSLDDAPDLVDPQGVLAHPNRA